VDAFLGGFVDELVKLAVTDQAPGARVGTGMQLVTPKPMPTVQPAAFMMPKFKMKGMPRPFNVNRWMTQAG
jgi:hypothetical protein